MREWFDKYSAQEQKIILGVAVLFLIWFLGFVVIKPIYKFKQRQQFDYENNIALLNYVKQSANTVASLKSNHNGVQNTDASVIVLVDRAIKQLSLPKPKRIQPSGQNKVSLEYSSVKFDSFFVALDILSQRYGIHVSQISVKKTKESGLVSLNALFERSL